ncbi:MAG: universal stress protein [Deltaproteobacteria bacterium]|nr:universal stress protein [Deltaproteobacteria bacterium]
MEKTTRTILLAVDLAPDGDVVAQHARDLARALGARVVACSVLEELEALVELNLPYVRYDELLPAEEEKARKSLAALVARELKGVPDVSMRVERGRTHTTILRLAEEAGADLIVIGTHGERGIERALYGSPAQRIIRGARVPVLVVPLEDKQAGAPGARQSAPGSRA